MMRFRFAGNGPETFEKTKRQNGKRSRDFENSSNRFDVAETPLQFLDDVITSFDLHFQVTVDFCASTQLLNRFDVADERSFAHLGTRT